MSTIPRITPKIGNLFNAVGDFVSFRLRVGTIGDIGVYPNEIKIIGLLANIWKVRFTMEQVDNISLENISTDITLEQFDKICRLCFSELETKPFFKLHFEGLLLFEIYQEITMLQVQEGDSLPEQICMACIEKIVYTFVFIKNCQQTDKILHSKIENSSTNTILLEEDVKAEPCMDDEKQDNEVTTEQFRLLESDGNSDNIKLEELHLNKNQNSDFYSVVTNQTTVNSEITNSSSNSSKFKLKMEKKGTQIKSDIKFSKIRRIIGELPRLTGPPFACDICNELYETFSEFKRHYKRSAKCLPRIYSCNVCAKRFVSKYKVRLHMRTHTNERPYECDVCDEKFRYAQNLVRHKRRHAGEKAYQCDVCKKRFTTSTSKIEHMRLHTGELPFLCTYCGMAFSRTSTLKLHTINHKRENGEQIKQAKEIPKKFQCSNCPKKYVTKTMLFVHEQSYHEGNASLKEANIQTKKHLCSTCGKTYATKATLAVHATMHSNIKSHFCHLCKKAFCYKSSLKNHILLHTGERPHTCGICNKTFVQSIHLRQHIRTHTGEKPNVCNFCGKGFALKGNLMVHKRQHTGETPYCCSVCDRGFSDSSSMKKHARTHREFKA